MCTYIASIRYKSESVYNQDAWFLLSDHLLLEISHSVSIVVVARILYPDFSSHQNNFCSSFGCPMDGIFPQARSCKKQETHSVPFLPSKWLFSSAFSNFYILSRIYHCNILKVGPVSAIIRSRILYTVFQIIS